MRNDHALTNTAIASNDSVSVKTICKLWTIKFNEVWTSWLVAFKVLLYHFAIDIHYTEIDFSIFL